MGITEVTSEPAAGKHVYGGKPSRQESVSATPPSAAGPAVRKMAAMGAAFACGALAMAGVFQLARSSAYLGPAGLLAGLVTGIVAALLARDDVSAHNFLRLLAIATAGASITLVAYLVGINLYSPGSESAVPYIQPIGDGIFNIGENSGGGQGRPVRDRLPGCP